MSEELHHASEAYPYRVSRVADGSFAVQLREVSYPVQELELDDHVLSFVHAGQRYTFAVNVTPAEVQVSRGAYCYTFQRVETGSACEDAGPQSELTSQMPGTVLKWLVEPGTAVAKGTPLMILEAMKMEHELCAPADGVVAGFLKPPGERVLPGNLLVDFKPADG